MRRSWKPFPDRGAWVEKHVSKSESRLFCILLCGGGGTWIRRVTRNIGRSDVLAKERWWRLLPRLSRHLPTNLIFRIWIQTSILTNCPHPFNSSSSLPRIRRGLLRYLDIRQFSYYLYTPRIICLFASVTPAWISSIRDHVTMFFMETT